MTMRDLSLASEVSAFYHPKTSEFWSESDVFVTNDPLKKKKKRDAFIQHKMVNIFI